MVPAREARVEHVVVNSRFIATAAPARGVDEARAFIARTRAEFPGAAHYVPAYRVGHGRTVIAHCSDDGEPAGTAGRPVLAMLEGSGLGDVVLVVTRYFGGTKLGTGGLVRAYGDAARAVLEIVPRAERVAVLVALLAAPYSLYERVRLATTAQGGEVVSEDFGADVLLTLRFPVERFTPFQAALCELTAGTLQAEVVETGEALVAVTS